MAAPESPSETTTVTRSRCAACRAAFHWAASAVVKHCSPAPALNSTTPPWVRPSRKAATAAALTAAVLPVYGDGIRTSRMAASGASACTISVSSASSVDASQGDAACARVFTTCTRAAGRPNLLSNSARSCRMSLEAGTWPPVAAPDAPVACGGNSSSTMVCPRPVIPRSSSGWMPYATRSCRGVSHVAGWEARQSVGRPDGAVAMPAAVLSARRRCSQAALARAAGLSGPPVRCTLERAFPDELGLGKPGMPWARMHSA